MAAIVHYIIDNFRVQFSEFILPSNRSFDIFLLEKGTKLSLITQEFLRPQPSLTLTRTTQLFMSLTITKTSNSTCQKITASEQMDCIVKRLGKVIIEENVSCLPLQVHTIFDEVFFDLPLCQNDIESAMSAFLVYNISTCISLV